MSTETGSRFQTHADAILRAEDMVRAFREADDSALTDLLLDAQADINASLMGLVLLSQVAIADAAEQRGENEEFMLRGAASWVLHVLANKEESDG